MDRTAVVWYLVVTEGLMLTAPRLGEAISEDVKSGAFAVHLLRPCSYVLFRFAVYLGEMVVSLALNLAAGSAVALCLVGPPPLRLPDLPLALIALGLGIVLNFCITCALGLVAFWVEDTDPFFWIHNKCLLILGGVMIPLEFFPDSLRWVADHAPFGSIFWAPARLVVLHDDGAPGLVLAQCGWIAFFAAVLWLVYRAGHRRVSVHGG
jgi:ABC-2 type transport system permease protein